eukprot:gene3224-3501_t
MTGDSSPFPSSATFPATFVNRDIRITGRLQSGALPEQLTATSIASGGASSKLLHWNCNHLTDRFTLQRNRTIKVANLVLLNCRSYSTLGVFRKQQGTTIVFDNVVDNQGSVCLPLEVASGLILAQHRQSPQSSSSGSVSSAQQLPQQVTSPGPQLLLTNIAVLETPTNSSNGAPFIFHAVNSALLCPKPVAHECISNHSPSTCLNAAYKLANPELEHPPCYAWDGFSLHDCIRNNQAVEKVVILQDAHFNLSTCPVYLADNPLLLTRNIHILADPRGPRLLIDCGFVPERVTVAPGLTITLQHAIVTNCDTPKAANLFRMFAGVNLVLIDTIHLPGPNMCLPLEQQVSEAGHKARPQHIPGNQPAIQFRDFAFADPYGWVGEIGSGVGAYNGSFYVHLMNGAVLCPEPLRTCGSKDARTCLAGAYYAVNTDVAVMSAEQAAAASQDMMSTGLKVVLPAVVGSLVGLVVFILLAAYIRFRSLQGQAAIKSLKGDDAHAAMSDKLPNSSASDPAHSTALPNAGQQAANDQSFFTWLVSGTTGPSGASSNDPTRQLLGIQAKTASTDTDGTFSSSRPSGSRLLATPDGIALNVMIGAGSFGRVYSGVWNSCPVAVKVIAHSQMDDRRIHQELSLSLSFNHPNLVRALHYVQMRITPGRPSLGAPSDSDSISREPWMPEGVVGAITLPSSWAITQQSSRPRKPVVDTETWIVMDLMDSGDLAQAVRGGAFLRPTPQGGSTLNMAPLLRRAADVAAGISYLHGRNVCHGDLKCENILLKSETQDPDGVLAKVADFGLSRALALGQSHLSTRRYGTVAMMPPELLVSGKLTPAADVYSFGIMLWQFVTAEIPFHGLHHGEIIHKVVTQDLRPGPWPIITASPELAFAAADAAAAGAAVGQYGSMPVWVHPDYIPLAEACWSRQPKDRPTMPQVLDCLLHMLADVITMESQAGGGHW